MKRLNTTRRVPIEWDGDFSDRHELDERMLQLQKMESIGQLAGGIAHDFNNVLTIIRAQGELLLGEPDLSLPIQTGLKEILEAAECGSAMVRRLLTCSRHQAAADFKDINLIGLLDSMLVLLEHVLGPKVGIAKALPSSLPLVRADESMMEQVLLNLVINARDSMPKGGTVRVSAEELMIDGAHTSRHPQARAGRHIRIIVADTGCGIPDEDLARIFEPFFTTKTEGKGTGLGLATVMSIVENHRGWIEVNSQVGVGSSFAVYLPALSGSRRRAPRWGIR